MADILKPTFGKPTQGDGAPSEPRTAAEVVELSAPTTLEIPPNKVIEGLTQKKFRMIMIVGEVEEEDGTLVDYYASSTPDCFEMLWALELYKKKLLDGEFGEED